MNVPTEISGFSHLSRTDPSRVLVLATELNPPDGAQLRSWFPEARIVSVRMPRPVSGVELLPRGSRAAVAAISRQPYDAAIAVQDHRKLKWMAVLSRSPIRLVLRNDTLVPFSIGDLLHQQRRIIQRRLIGERADRLLQTSKDKAWRAFAATIGDGFGIGNDYGFIGEPSIRATKPCLGVSVVVPVYNRKTVLAKTLAALTLQTYPRTLFDIVIADDGSSDHPETLIKAFPQLSIDVVRQEDLGFRAAAVRNLGIKEARREVVVLLDCDMIPAPDFLSQHLRWFHATEAPIVVIGHRRFVDPTHVSPEQIMQSFEAIAGLGIRPSPEEIRNTEDPTIDWRVPHYRSTDMLRRHEAPFRFGASGNLSFRKELALQAGLFDESFNQWGGEDIEFSYRLHRLGAYFIPDLTAVAYHHEHPRAELSEEQLDASRRFTRSRIPHGRYVAPGERHHVPKVSVLMPEVSEDSADTAHSVLNQTMGDLELIVSAPVFVEDPRINVVHSQGPRPVKLRALLNACRGEHVLIVEPDEELTLGAVGALVRVLDKHPMVSLSCAAWDERGDRRGRASAKRQPANSRSGPRAFRIRDCLRAIGTAESPVMEADLYETLSRRGLVYRLRNRLSVRRPLTSAPERPGVVEALRNDLTQRRWRRVALTLVNHL